MINITDNPEIDVWMHNKLIGYVWNEDQDGDKFVLLPEANSLPLPISASHLESCDTAINFLENLSQGNWWLTMLENARQIGDRNIVSLLWQFGDETAGALSFLHHGKKPHINQSDVLAWDESYPFFEKRKSMLSGEEIKASCIVRDGVPFSPVSAMSTHIMKSGGI